MTTTVFVNTVTLSDEDWFNDLDRLHYDIFGDPPLAFTSNVRISNIPIGAVAYGSLGTNAVHVAGTIYVSELFIPYRKTITGLAVLNGATVGTDSLIVGLYAATGGAVLANSALAGTATSGANAFQEIALTATYDALAGKYYAAVQCEGTTPKTRRIAANTYLNLTKSFVGAFGTLTSLTVPTTTTADVGPIVYAY